MREPRRTGNSLAAPNGGFCTRVDSFPSREAVVDVVGQRGSDEVFGVRGPKLLVRDRWDRCQPEISITLEGMERGEVVMSTTLVLLLALLLEEFTASTGRGGALGLIRTYCCELDSLFGCTTGY
mmetsp:Transcript_2727/g.4892  ORF Transcript_2727/g.4892 Transcript_2727/m.4892 type:complete len:124 (-) Transcript_2727:910-1281(-)